MWVGVVETVNVGRIGRVKLGNVTVGKGLEGAQQGFVGARRGQEQTELMTKALGVTVGSGGGSVVELTVAPEQVGFAGVGRVVEETGETHVKTDLTGTGRSGTVLEPYIGGIGGSER